MYRSGTHRQAWPILAIISCLFLRMPDRTVPDVAYFAPTLQQEQILGIPAPLITLWEESTTLRWECPWKHSKMCLYRQIRLLFQCQKSMCNIYAYTLPLSPHFTQMDVTGVLPLGDRTRGTVQPGVGQDWSVRTCVQVSYE